MRLRKYNPKKMRQVSIIVPFGSGESIYHGKYAPLRFDVTTIPNEQREHQVCFVYGAWNDFYLLTPCDSTLGDYKDFCGTFITDNRIFLNKDQGVYFSFVEE